MKPRLLRAARLFAIAIAVLVGTTVVPLPSAPAATATVLEPVKTAAFGIVDLLDLATYRIHTVHRNDNGSITDRTVGALIAVPRPVNVDASPLSLPDLVVEVLPLPPNRVTLLIKRLGGSALPLSVELLFDLPGAANGGVAVGYDALASSAPSTFSTSLTFSSTPASSDIRLDVDTAGASSSLVLVADLFTRADGGARVDPTAVRVGLNPVPAHLGAHVATDVVANRVVAELTSSAATRVEASVDDTKGARHRKAGAVVDRLPTSAAVEILSDPDGGHDEIRFTASSAVASVTATIDDAEGDARSKLTGTATNVPSAMALSLDTADDGAQRAAWRSNGRLGGLSVQADGFTAGVLDRQARFEIQDLAPAIDLVRSGDTSFALTADSPIGVIEAGVATGGPVALLAEPSYLNAVKEDGGRSSVAARIVGLSSFTAGLGDPVTVGATVTPGPFHARIVQPGRTVDATVTDFPAQASVSFSPTAGVVEYHGSDVIGTLDVDVTSDTRLISKADHAHLVVTGLPRDLRLDFGPRSGPATTASPSTAELSVRRICVPDETTGCPDPIPPDPDPDPGDPPPPGGFPDLSKDVRIVIDANGATVGAVDVLLNTKPFLPSKPLAADEDGVVIDDLADRFVLAGRITGLKRASVRVRTEDRRNFDRFLGTRAHAELHTDAALTDLRQARVESRTARAGGGVDSLVATVSDLPADVVVDLVSTEIARPPNPKGTQLTYDASSAIGAVTVDADLAALPNPFHASVTDVPSHFTVCHATDGQCHDGDEFVVRDRGSFLFDATSAATLDAFLCLEPKTGTCVSTADATSFVLVQGLKVERLGFEFHLGAFTPDNPLLAAFDTDSKPVTGRVVFSQKDVLRVDLNFPGPLTVAYTGPNLIGNFTGPLHADDFVLRAFDPDGLLKVVRIQRDGTFGCADLQTLFLDTPIANVPLRPILCP